MVGAVIHMGGSFTSHGHQVSSQGLTIGRALRSTLRWPDSLFRAITPQLVVEKGTAYANGCDRNGVP
jgi:hypothetical protein